MRSPTAITHHLGVKQLAHHSAVTRFAPTPSGPLVVLDSGPMASGARPTVLLVPGYTGSKEDFAPLLDPFSDLGYRAVAMDQRGQHESPGIADPRAYTMDALAADVLSVIDHLGGSVHLIGHSFGGLVCRAAVIAQPTAVTSLTLMGSGPAAIAGQRRETIELLEPVLAAGGTPAVHAMVEQRATAEPGWRQTPVALRAFLRRRFLASHEVGLQAMSIALRTEPDRVAELAAAGIPILVTFGAADDAWPPAVQREMAARLGARLAVIPDAVHSPAVENPAATLRTLTDFWAAL